jgi:thiamine-phosphate pyrophosphorylase
MPTDTLQRGLYLVTPDEPDVDRLLARVVPLLPFASCLQLRNKVAETTTLRAMGQRLRAACIDAGVPLVINDDPALAAELGAEGVHLGEHDGGIANARAMLGESAIIGASCYDSLHRARDAAAAGADYVAFGAFFPSATKPSARRASTSLLRDSAALGIPRVAIGGITPENAPSLVAAGADLIAVIGGVFDAADPIAAARACSSLFETASRP